MKQRKGGGILVDEQKQREYIDTMVKEASRSCVKCKKPLQHGKWVSPSQVMCNPCIQKSRREDKKYWATEQNDESHEPRDESRGMKDGERR